MEELSETKANLESKVLYYINDDIMLGAIVYHVYQFQVETLQNKISEVEGEVNKHQFEASEHKV